MRIILPIIGCFIILTLAGCAGDATDTATSSSDPPVQLVSASQAIPAPDSLLLARFQEAMQYARDQQLHRQPVGRVMQEMGTYYLGAPYIIGPLDETDEEQLVCRLDGFDCFTFVETMLAMAHGIVEEDYAYESFAHRVMNQRYREGAVQGYCSRLHYFTEWLRENEKRGAVTDRSRALGGEHLEKQISYMSEHREAYAQLADDRMYACIKDMEENLADMEIFYIPQSRIVSAYDRLQAGDVVATATNVEGLDVSHTGLVYDPGSSTSGKGLLHASMSGGVKVSPDLQAYVQNVENQIGIIVARPLPPDSLDHAED